jgi:hypothetical protein
MMGRAKHFPARDKTDKTDKTPAATTATHSRSERLKALIQAVRALPGSEAHIDRVLQAEAEFIVKLASNLAEEKAIDRPASRRNTQNEIDKAIKLAGELANHMESLHFPAANSLSNWGCNPGEIVEHLNVFTLKAARPEVLEHALSLATEKRGRRGDREAFILAYQCARTFWLITQTPPMRRVRSDDADEYGPYFDFVEAVFIAMDIPNPVPAVARKAKIALEKTMEKKP